MNSIDPLDDRYLSLPRVRLVGPRLGRDDPRPLWRLWANTPRFGAERARDDANKGSGETADDVFGIRVLRADPAEPSNTGRWLQPRLVSLHVVVGEDTDIFKPADALELACKPVDERGVILGDYGKTLLGLPESGLQGEPPIAHVVGEALASAPFQLGDKTIEFPQVRLTAGRVGMRILLSKEPYRWLAGLGIKRREKPEEDYGDVWLTPDGIEFDATLSLPWHAESLLGRVLLSSDEREGSSSFVLKFLRPANQTPDWLNVWREILPKSENEDHLLGVLLKADRSRIPSFRWRVSVSEKALAIEPGVEIPAEALACALRSPPIRGEVDGMAWLRSAFWKATSSEEKKLRLEATVGDTSGAELGLSCFPTKMTLGTTQESLTLDVDDDKLVRDLRSCYGWKEPSPKKEDATADERPLIPAFLPLTDGWLQWPVPNLPPTDTTVDANLMAVPLESVDSVLDGFFRLRRPGANQAVLSAYHPENEPVAGIPFLLTIEAAAGAMASIDLNISSDGDATHGLPELATISLRGAKITSTGLMVVSANRPDALDALPRLSAGPGLVIPVSLFGTHLKTVKPASTVGVRFETLLFQAVRPGLGAKDDTQITIDDGKMALVSYPMALRLLEALGRPEWLSVLRATRAVLLADPGELKKEQLELAEKASADLALARSKRRAAQRVYQQARRKLDAVEARMAHVRAWWEELIELLNSDRNDQFESLRGESAVIYTSAEAALKEARKSEGPAAKALDEADKAFSRELKNALSAAGFFGDLLTPLPAVAWVRDLVMPLAASMPMTRSARSSTRPLESRDLIPASLAVERGAEGQAEAFSVTLATLDREKSGLYALSGVPLRERLTGWPSTTLNAELGPDRGVFFAAIGVPGVEWCPGKTMDLSAALRYDLPTLDEAFATAELPPTAPVLGAPVVEKNLPRAATALDWVELGRFWQDQERKLQNSRVAHSYVTPFGGVTPDKPVTNLVEGLRWEITVESIRATLDLTEEVPYGKLILQPSDDNGPVKGNQALLGHSGRYDVGGKKLTFLPDAKSGALEILGFSPSTIADGDFHLDNRRAASAGCVEKQGLLCRPSKVAGAPGDLVTLLGPVPFVVSGDGAQSLPLLFWFKDAWVGKEASAKFPNDDLDFGIWDDPVALAAAGLEWRLGLKPSEPDALKVFKSGQHQVPFFGFWLEPVRLRSLGFARGAIGISWKAASIECRLSLGQRDGLARGADNRLMLDLAFDGEKATAKWSAPPWAFRLEANRRQLALEFGPKKDSPNFTLDPTKVTVEVAGQDLELVAGASTVKCGFEPATGLMIVIKREPRKAGRGEGFLAVPLFELTVTSDGVATVKGDLQVILACANALPVDNADQRLVAPVLDVIARLGGGPKASAVVRWLGATVEDSQLIVQEGEGAITLLMSEAKLKVGSVPEFFALAVALAARCESGTDIDGALRLSAGCLKANLLQKGEGTVLPGVVLKGAEASVDLRTDSLTKLWTGQMSFSGTVVADNAITWPIVEWPKAEEAIPPSQGKPTLGVDGRVRVEGTGKAGGLFRHTVTWRFSNHRAPLELLGKLLAGSPHRIWSAPVMAEHTLVRESEGDPPSKIAWNAIETVAVGALAVIVPTEENLRPGLEGDDTTFAPREEWTLKGGAGGRRVAGMKKPGRGAVATVLQGVLGAAFRAAFHASERSEKILLAGGFLGWVETSPTRTAYPLLRLPVLAGLEKDSVAQRALERKGESFELAWADGPAARFLAVTRPTGPQPANASLDAITTAMIAGSRVLPALSPEEQMDPVAALLVEQSFPQGEFPYEINNPANIPHFEKDLAVPPYFLSATVSLSRCFKQLKQNCAFAAVSLVAAHLRRQCDTGAKLPLAAALRLSPALRDWKAVETQESAYEEKLNHGSAETTLSIVGAGLYEEPWTGAIGIFGNPQTEILRATVAEFALGRDRQPLAALLSVRRPGEVGIFIPMILAEESVGILPAVGAVESDNTLHADMARGPMWFCEFKRKGNLVELDTASVRRSLYPAGEGPAKAIRDELSKGDNLPSGLAGLTRRMAWPQQAATVLELDAKSGGDGFPVPGFVWFSQISVPVYLPLHTTGLRGPAIGWLRPAPPAVRLPTDEQIRASVTPSAAENQIQPFLPAEVERAEVSERAGVLTVRRGRFLSALGTVNAIDVDFARFGRAAQAGTSFARTLRTPRPGPLPDNVQNSGRNRRIQASYVHPTVAIDPVKGSADVISGTDELLGEWSVRVTALSSWRSVVTDRWDGTVRLECRISTERSPSKKIQPLSLLPKLIWGFDGGLNLKARAAIKVGDVTISYQTLIAITEKESENTDGPYIAEAVVILEPAVVEGYAKGAPLAKLSQALSDRDSLPSVEFQWMVYPTALEEKESAGITLNTPYNLALGATEPLLVGDKRSPVTLRFTLYPAAPETGLLELWPASIIFSDPAYDRTLANTPVSEAKPLTDVTDLENGRGRLMVSLHADRRQVHALESVTLMLDVRYEKPLGDVAQAAADAAGVSPGGDVGGTNPPTGVLSFSVEPKEGAKRELQLGSLPAGTAIRLEPGKVCELPLVSLRELDGSAARLIPGDLVTVTGGISSSASVPAVVNLYTPAMREFRPVIFGAKEMVSVVVRLAIAPEPTLPPPPALYVCLLRTRRRHAGKEGFSIATALHAQSPLPARADLPSPARDFRKGLMNRRAVFVWSLLRPESEFFGNALAVIKQDRNGQTWLPDKAGDFFQLDKSHH